MDKGHTYPNLVRGLVSPSFGVYNCDQTYQQGKTVQLAPVYVDASTGKEITSPNVVCVIDHKINCSLSFDPVLVNIGVNSENDVLLFTKSNEVFLLSKENLAALNLTSQTNGAHLPFTMKNISDKVKNSDDLKAYLNL